MKHSRVEFLEGLHGLMQTFLEAAHDDDWDRVDELDKLRSSILKHIPPGTQPASSQEQALLSAITKADQTLINLSEAAALISQQQASAVTRKTSHCSEYLTTQKY